MQLFRFSQEFGTSPTDARFSCGRRRRAAPPPFEQKLYRPEDPGICVCQCCCPPDGTVPYSLAQAQCGNSMQGMGEGGGYLLVAVHHPVRRPLGAVLVQKAVCQRPCLVSICLRLRRPPLRLCPTQSFVACPSGCDSCLRYQSNDEQHISGVSGLEADYRIHL